MWDYVIPHFKGLLSNLDLTQPQKADALAKCDGIARKIWAEFWSDNDKFSPDCYQLVGGYGKNSAIRPPSDADLAVMLPNEVYQRIATVSGNKQSYLLRLVKEALEDKYPSTTISQDGQIVAVAFETYLIEVLPFFWDEQNKAFLFPDTNAGGKWRTCRPWVEVAELDEADRISRGKARDLVKMMKAWKRVCEVPIKSLVLELLASSFVKTWEFRDESVFYYDWLVRDFFAFLSQEKDRWLLVPGTNQLILSGNAWVTKAQSAHLRASKACVAEHDNAELEALVEWRKIFGNYM